MGGTFIALIDDATAAEANPAGLTQLTRSEVSIHGRRSDAEVEVLDLNAVVNLDAMNRFRTAGPRVEPGSRIGNSFAEDTQTIFRHSVTEASFASYVKPFESYTFSVFYQRAADFAGANDFAAFDDSLLDLYQTRQQLDLALENVGVSAAFKAGDFVAVGFSIRYSRLELAALQETRLDYLQDLELDRLPPGSSLDQVRALGIVDQRISREVFDGDDGTVTFNAGVLLNPGGRWSLGLVYKDGGEFDVAGASEDFNCNAPFAAGNLSCNPVSREPANQRIRVSDFLGLGLAWRATGWLKLALDVNHITYSYLALGPANDPNVQQQFEKIDDEMELHFGVEHVFFLGSGQRPLTALGGFYTDPDHDGFRAIDSDDTVYTFGLGTVVNESFQIDLAGQFSDRKDAGILSLVYRF